MSTTRIALTLAAVLCFGWAYGQETSPTGAHLRPLNNYKREVHKPLPPSTEEDHLKARAEKTYILRARRQKNPTHRTLGRTTRRDKPSIRYIEHHGPRNGGTHPDKASRKNPTHGGPG
ncbi:MAG: hypothetical protein OHK0039_12040 [Bacteroidia bacterium]